MQEKFLESKLGDKDFEILYLLADGDITKYDQILNSNVEVVFNTLYLKKLKIINDLVNSCNELKNLN